jgi:biopolymer transport protein TolQ
MEPVQAVTLTTHSADISFIALFLQASLVVQIVMIGLVFASVWCWGIVLNKLAQIKLANTRARRFEKALVEAATLDDLYLRVHNQPKDSYAEVFVAALGEWQKTIGHPQQPETIIARLERVMQAAQSRTLGKLERSLPVLASIGSVSPFVGLFGTVWGIMTSFQAIASAKNTSLAVVAPGIAEALLATAIGLLAAIPAVLAFNKFTNDINHFGVGLQSFSDDLLAVILRQVRA